MSAIITNELKDLIIITNELKNLIISKFGSVRPEVLDMAVHMFETEGHRLPGDPSFEWIPVHRAFILYAKALLKVGANTEREDGLVDILLELYERNVPSAGQDAIQRYGGIDKVPDSYMTHYLLLLILDRLNKRGE